MKKKILLVLLMSVLNLYLAECSFSETINKDENDFSQPVIITYDMTLDEMLEKGEKLLKERQDNYRMLPKKFEEYKSGNKDVVKETFFILQDWELKRTNVMVSFANYKSSHGYQDLTDVEKDKYRKINEILEGFNMPAFGKWQPDKPVMTLDEMLNRAQSLSENKRSHMEVLRNINTLASEKEALSKIEEWSAKLDDMRFELMIIGFNVGYYTDQDLTDVEKDKYRKINEILRDFEQIH